MCWYTNLYLTCTSPTCSNPTTPYNQTQSTDPCQYAIDNSPPKDPTSQHPWTCSICVNIAGGHVQMLDWKTGRSLKTPRKAVSKELGHFHDAQVEHRIWPDGTVTLPRGQCPDCEGKGKAPAPFPPTTATFSLPDRTTHYATLLHEHLIDPSNITTEFRSIASTTDVLRTQHGISPHAWASAILFLASNTSFPKQNAHEKDYPATLPARLLCSTLHIAREPFQHAYSILYSNRDLIELPRHLSLRYLPKPCCFRAQNRDCPTHQTQWNTTRIKCTGIELPPPKDFWSNYRHYKYSWWYKYGNTWNQGPIKTDLGGLV